jgi:DnaJ family protein C protein 19
MGKLLTLALIAILGCKVLTGCWPWELLRASAHSPEEARARALLGLGKTARREEIIDAHRRLLTRVHPDKGGTGEQVLEANAARDLLLARLANSDDGKTGRG